MTATSRDEDAFRAAFQIAVRQAREDVHPDANWRPRGIIIPAGGARMFTCAWVTVRMLREKLRTRLPIQVWHLGPEEMSPAMAALLAEQDVETVDALTLADERHAGTLGGFELKSFALLHCGFREVFLLDADNVPLIDPEEIFEHEAYQSTGAVFWPDIVSLLPASRIWDLCGVPYRAMQSFESGQAAVDRQRCHGAVSLSWFLNRHSPLLYQHIYGDKDTFLMAWLALDQPFHLVEHRVTRLHGCMCQHHPDGRRMFQHRNQQKWQLHGINPRMEGFLEEDRCFGFLEELRNSWTGRVFTPPKADEEMRALEQAMIEARSFTLETVSIGKETVELHPGNLVKRTTGRPACWWLSRENGAITLVLGEDQVINRRFARYGHHYWRSRAPGSDGQDIILVHAPGAGLQAPPGHNSDSIYRSFTDWHSNYDWIGKSNGV